MRGLLRAIVNYVSKPVKSEKDDKYMRLCLDVGTLPFFVNAWDNSKFMASHLQEGDYIETMVELCPWKDLDGEYHYTYKTNSGIYIIEQPEELGLYMEDKGVITSMDVHVGCGRGNRVIAIDTDTHLRTKEQRGEAFQKKLYRVHLIVPQSSNAFDGLDKGSKLQFNGIVDPSLEDRVTFTKVFTIMPIGELTYV